MLERGARHAMLSLLLLAACSESSSTPAPTTSTPVTAAGVLLVVGDAAALNASERAIVARLESQGHPVVVQDDDAATAASANGRALVILSKTIQSRVAGATFRDAERGVLFWEDNAQAPAMMATIDDTELVGTAWHRGAAHVAVDPSAPAALRAGLAGRVALYQSSDEITYAPRTSAGAQTLGAHAIRVAEFESAGSALWSIYAYDVDAKLADGSTAAGRRVYFGLYDDTYAQLTEAGLRLFDAAVAWAAEATP